MNAAERLTGKVKRAHKHILDLEDACRSFYDSRPYEVEIRANPDKLERSYHILSIQPVPVAVLAICGDAVHCLRSALDHLAWHLVSRAGHTPTHFTSFPVADSAKQYASAYFRRKLEGINQDAKDTIDALKPYKGGNDFLWILNRLDNIDKHRLLLAIGSAHRAHSMTPSQRAEICKIFAGSHPGRVVPDLRGVLVQPAKIAIVKAGDVLRTIPESEVEQEMRFHFDVSFDEPGVITSEPIIETLQRMAKVVASVILAFEPGIDPLTV